MTLYDTGDDYGAGEEQAAARQAARDEIGSLARLVQVMPLVVVDATDVNRAVVSETAGGPVVGIVYVYAHVGVLAAGQTVDVLMVGGRPRAVLGRIVP